MMASDDASRQPSKSVKLFRQISHKVSPSKTKRYWKRQHAVAVFVILVMLFQVYWHWRKQQQLVNELMQTFDRDNSTFLTFGELTKLLQSNGVQLDTDEVQKLFGVLDPSKNGFDGRELQTLASSVQGLPTTSERLKQVGQTSNSLYFDLFVTAIIGGGLAYLVFMSHFLTAKWASTQFKDAVSLTRVTSRAKKTEDIVRQLALEKNQLEERIASIDEACPQARVALLEELQSQLAEVNARFDDARSKMETEITAWRDKAHKSMEDAERHFKLMDRMTACIKGVDAFEGAGSPESKFLEQGAQRGFSKSLGFAMDTVTFGTMREGQLYMYETSDKWKLGDGRDCAYSCKCINSGKEFALKKYRISDQRKRESALKDLFALRSQLSSNPRVMDYEQVIESQEMVYVLMEFIKGRDLYDVILHTENGLSEKAARPLFRHLLEAVVHLHRHNVIHCDIKPENAMVVGDEHSGDAHLKLIDFGCACFKQYEKEDLHVPYDPYTAPEHLGEVRTEPNESSDMWRVGCTLFVMLLRRPPFAADSKTEQGMKARMSNTFFKTPEFKNRLSSEAQDLISNLILADPAKRLTAEGALAHSWLQDS